MYNLIDIISNFFQRNFQLIIDNQIYKEGKLILINKKDFYIKFNYIDKKHNKMKYYELPMPYDFTVQNSQIILDYTNATFCNNNEDILLNMCKINNDHNHHVLYNKQVILNFYV